jgi:TetR/AcrR family transcriptional regulator, transcriptional repressor for nem operon
MNVQLGPLQAAETRDRLLRTAFQLFHEQGFNATGVATILREAGVNPGSMYHFFESKDELLLHVLDFSLGYLSPAVMDPAEAKTADPIGRVFALLDQYRTGMDRRGCKMGCPIGNLALEVSDGNAKARALIHRNFENWVDRVERWLVAAGDRLPLDVDRRRLARFVLTVMEGGLMQSRAAGTLEPFDEAVETLREHLKMLAGRGSVSTRKKRVARSSRRHR